MRHARPDYDRIQDPQDLIPSDEPVFLLRAQDIAAPATVEHWAFLARGHGASKQIVKAAMEQAVRMRNYQNIHVKIPDLPEGE